MKIASTKVIEQTIDKIATYVTQTMGAKGRLAVINDEFSRPLLTDDGVTVAKQFMNLNDPFEKMVALSICEAASNTERYAFDGTTLTILLTQQLYHLGLHEIKKSHLDPQMAAAYIEGESKLWRMLLKDQVIKLDSQKAEQLAVVTTKMPVIGNLVRQAYDKAGDAMNVIIEHDRKSDKHSIEHVAGMVLDHGFFSNEMQQLCNDDTHTKTVFRNAHLLLLSEGQMSQRDIINFFRSIPEPNVKDPYVIFISKAFSPESLKMLLDQLVNNHFTFQFVFINETNPEEVFVDLAARTNGHIQSAAEGTSEYKFEYCGFAKEIVVEMDKTTIFSDADQTRVDQRIAAYRKELEDNRYSMHVTRSDTINRRLSNLSGGVTKIKLACQTSTEYMTIRLKLDDAIGAVKCAAKEGLLPGGGVALLSIIHATTVKYKKRYPINKVLSAPIRTICKNAGHELTCKEIQTILDKNGTVCYDVNSMQLKNIESVGLYDSFSSIDRAISNAASIASNYLKAYALIHQNA